MGIFNKLKYQQHLKDSFLLNENLDDFIEGLSNSVERNFIPTCPIYINGYVSMGSDGIFKHIDGKTIKIGEHLKDAGTKFCWKCYNPLHKETGSCLNPECGLLKQPIGLDTDVKETAQ